MYFYTRDYRMVTKCYKTMEKNFANVILRRGVCAVFTAMLCAGLMAQKQTDIRLAEGGPDTPENRLIKLRDAMQAAAGEDEKERILSEIGKTGTFLGMMYAGNYAGDPKLGKAASAAAVAIAVQHPEYDGDGTRSLLSRCLPNLKGKARKQAAALLGRPAAGPGFVSVFNGKDLSGWKGLVDNPIARAELTPEEHLRKQVKADELMKKDWVVEDGMICYVGSGFDNLCTKKKYGDFEMYIDWRLDPNGKEPDAGIYLRGTPQVQIWDTSRVDVGAQVGSGGLYNNQENRSTPLVVADNKLGMWNSFYIKMTGDKVTVVLNGVKVVDNVPLENYWDRSRPIFPAEQIELQAHGSKVYYRDIYIKETQPD